MLKRTIIFQAGVFICLICTLLACRNKTKNTIGIESFIVNFSIENGEESILRANVDGKEIKTGAKVEKGKIVIFTVESDVDFEVEEWIGIKDNFGTAKIAALEINKNTEVKVKLKNDFIKIIPPKNSITGKDPAYELPDPNIYWKGVFVSGRNIKLNPFVINKYEVSYKLWYEVYSWAKEYGYIFENAGMESNSGTIGAPPTEKQLHPVTFVTWNDAIIWCNAYTHMKYMNENDCVYRKSKNDSSILKNAKNRDECNKVFCDLSKKGYRLPTEAEWEFAARIQADSDNAENYGTAESAIMFTNLNSVSGANKNWKDIEESNKFCWNFNNSNLETHIAVEEKNSRSPNKLGLYNMSGNVWEWCFDWYNDDASSNDAAYLQEGVLINPMGGTAIDANRALRGGGYADNIPSCIIGNRSLEIPHNTGNNIGFRLVRTKHISNTKQ